MENNSYKETLKQILEVVPSLEMLIPNVVLHIKVERRFTGGKEIAIIGLNGGVDVRVSTPLTNELKDKLGL